MSATLAFDNDGSGWPAVNPSPVPALLRALARRFHHLAQTSLATVRRARRELVRTARIVGDAALTTIASIRDSSGFGAAASLIATGGQVFHLAGRVVVAHIVAYIHLADGLVRDAVASHAQIRSPRWAVALARHPRTGAALAGATLAVAGCVALRQARRRLASRRPNPLTLSRDQVRQIRDELYVVITPDGSVNVHGIPTTLPAPLRETIARVAADAATQRMHALVRRGRPLSTHDLETVTTVTREAVIGTLASPGAAR